MWWSEHFAMGDNIIPIISSMKNMGLKTLHIRWNDFSHFIYETDLQIGYYLKLQNIIFQLLLKKIKIIVKRTEKQYINICVELIKIHPHLITLKLLEVSVSINPSVMILLSQCYLHQIPLENIKIKQY